jgi:hypothetical protein
MVKVKGVPPMGRGTRRPGRLVQTKVRGGIPIMKGWPRKRGPIKAEEQRETAHQFKLAQQAANEAHPWMWIEAENMSQGTIWNRREILVKCAQGSFYDITLDNGEFYGGWFNLAREIQALLDTVTDETGHMLYRSSSGWIALVPGPDGYYLQSNGPDFLPAWAPVSEPSPSFQWSCLTPTDNFTGGDETVGLDITPMIDAEISDVAFKLDYQSGAGYEFTICETNGSNVITAILQQFVVTTIVSSQNGTVLMPLPVLQALTAKQRYSFLVTKLSGSPGGSMNVKKSRSDQAPLPCADWTNVSRAGSSHVSVGTSLSTSSGAACVNMKFREL